MRRIGNKTSEKTFVIFQGPRYANLLSAVKRNFNSLDDGMALWGRNTPAECMWNERRDLEKTSAFGTLNLTLKPAVSQPSTPDDDFLFWSNVKVSSTQLNFSTIRNQNFCKISKPYDITNESTRSFMQNARRSLWTWARARKSGVMQFHFCTESFINNSCAHSYEAMLHMLAHKVKSRETFYCNTNTVIGQTKQSWFLLIKLNGET